ncbi:restriction endonuclease subunit S [Ligilactobacillus salivarius]|uniref:restriction endonuclease subunit S n=1 Tax=Ligilactobacillus salivarius TaxID=1624 RepID=UPI0029676E00|nr:restriction endonuclease subunit S [Ligilactobacillus salivarius]MDW3022381.1 restriction endonuclease subunit S [Ligilactobacillus salivarius]
MAKEEKKAPKLRFNGYTNDWERKELNNILKINSGRDYKQLNSGNIPVYGTGGYMLSVNDKLSDTDAVGIGRKGTIDKPLYLKAPFWTVDTLFYCTSKENSDVKFIYLLFQIINWKRYDESTGIPSLSKNTISNIKTYVPKIKEQDYISKLFFSLDNTIQLHERKCEELTLIKQALLQKLFPKKDKVRPEVRYKNFSDAWEQRKLNNFLETSKLKNLNHKFKKEDILSVSGDYGIVNQMEFQGRSFAGASLKNYRVVEKQNVVYTKSPLKANPYGIIKANKGNKGIVSTLYAVYKTKGDVSANFVEYYFANDYRLNAYLKPIVNKGAKNTILISDDNAINGKVIFPLDHVEQKKIGAFLADFDSLITLHQGKLEKLKKMKKFLLQNMFI